MADFKGYKRQIRLDFDWQSVKDGIPRVKKQMTILNAEFKKTYEEAKATGKPLETLGARYDYLTERIKINETAIEEYRKKLETAKRGQGESAKSIENNTVELRKQEAELARMKTALTTVTKEMEYQQSVVDKNSEEWKDLEYQLKLNDEQFKKARAETELSGDAVKGLKTEHEFLTENIKIQEQQVKMYREKLKEATQAETQNEQAVKDNTLGLAEAESQLAETKVELDRVTQELEKQKSTLGKTADEWDKIGTKMTDIGKSMTLKVTAPILGAAAASFKLGADFEDAFGKAEVVFGRNTREIEAWSKTALKEFGLSRVTALEMVSDFAAGFNQLGIDVKKSTEWSKKLTSLTTDMSAFYNTSLDETNRALTAILSGQTEPLKKFQIYMTQANLQQFAYQKGIKKSVQEMSEAEKVQLRYNYVIEKTTQSHGQFKREQDSATAQLILFKESLEELGTSFSEEILPIFTPVLKGVNNMIQKFSELNKGTKKFIVIVGGIVAAIGPVLIFLGNIFKAISNINEGLKLVKGGVDIATGAGKIFNQTANDSKFFGFAKWALIIAGVALALGYLIDKINIFLGKTEQVNSELNDMGNIANSISGASSRGNNVSRRYINGSHKSGLDYVPYDGYIAELHRGERVQTAEENPLNGGKGGGDTYILQVDMDEVDEVYKLVNVFEQFKQAKRAGVV
jgi:hypothetical protein